MKAEIIVLANQKGGCGKTTSATTFARISALDNKNTLLIDLDPNGSATLAADAMEGLLPSVIDEKNAYAMFKEDPANPSDLVVPTKGGYDMIMGTMELLKADQFLMNESDAAKYFIDLVYDDEGLNQYDRIFIDTGGRVGPLLTAVVVAADKVITSSNSSSYDTPQTARMPAFVEKCAKIKARDVFYKDRPLKLSSVFFTAVNEKAATDLNVIEKFIENFPMPEVISQTIVPYETNVKRAALFNQTIVDYRPSSAPAQAYVSIYNEIFNSGFQLEGVSNGE